MRYFCIVLAILISNVIWSQENQNLYLDDLGFAYLLDGSKVKKYDAKGEELFVYSRMDLGDPDYLDVSDPLRIAAVYLENGIVAVLDNTLSEQRVVRLWNTQLGLPSYVASGVNEQIWVYDALSKEVVLLDNKLERVLTTGYLPAILGREPSVIGMAERHEQLIIADADYGLWVFDRFGTLVHRHPIDGIRWIKAHADGVLLSTTTGWKWWKYGAVTPAKFPVVQEIKVFDRTGGKAVILNSGKPQVIPAKDL